ncbi:SusC/RagA family TonB-linked outer membrane protein [Parapedobacter soli]|uniref:SusC/RagA family TonB-linked outer membrane protein n=1 Tax=Parapedobacter soli TaxID=416955 RepID=UPI0021C753D6|nr:SusC/RagA family TonB-linked outer membrane protein [Parapedobacter soli]
MRITTLLIIAGCMHLSARSLSQTVTLRVNNQPITKIFETVEKQTGYQVIYSDRFIKSVKPVTIVARQMALADFLETILTPEALTYQIKERTILIAKLNPAPETDELGVGAEQPNQERVITGSVRDERGSPLVGVTVSIKGTPVAVTTDASGNYRLPINQEGTTLVFSMLGFHTLEQPAGTDSTIHVTMTAAVSDLEEVVVVGYGTQKRSDLTGSIASADMDALRGTPNVNVMQSLQGTVPGLNVGMTDEAGENPAISVRGRTSLSGNKNPLVILDGIIFYGSLTSINPNDIRSIDILKDASSKAIYGAQAANGVILITTKKGVSEKPIITYTGSYSFGEPSNMLQTRNRESYLRMIHDIFWMDAYTEESNYLQPNEDFNILETQPFSTPVVVRGFQEGVDTDWWQLGTTDAMIQQHNANIQGSSARTNYFLSLGYDRQQNFIINDKFNRKSARMNVESQITDWLNVGAQTFGTFSDYSDASPNISQLTQSGPLRFPFDEDGSLITEFGGGTSNPLIPLYIDDLDRRNELFGNFYVKIKAPFLPGLTWDINYGNALRWTRQFRSNPYALNETGEVQKYNGEFYNYTFDNILNYSRQIGGNHHIHATFVIGKTHHQAESTTARATDIANQTLGYNDLSQGINQFTTSGSWEETSLYQMARLNYAAFSKYYITATLRRDGFSGFAENEKIGHFPSVAAAWTASEEPFMSDAAWLDHLKLRFSYGVNGNLVGRYSSLARISASGAYVFGDGGQTSFGHAPSSLPNNDLRWERTRGSNAGLDFEIFGGRVSGNVEYYQTTTRDLIWNMELPVLTGFNSIISNIGQIGNRGLEIAVTAIPFQSADFRWTVTGNVSHNRNRIERLLGDIDGDGREDDLIASNLFIGEAVGAVFGYDVDGIYQLGDDIPAGYYVGSYRIIDRNGDGVLSASDRVILGMTDPLYHFGIHNHLKYKDFSLKVFINSIQGGKTGYLGANEPFGANSPQNISQMGIWEEVDFWTPSNPGARFRSPAGTSSINPALYESRSFVRLQDLILSYNFEPDLLSKLKLSNLTATLSGKNLFTWTRWNGWDPETAMGIGYNGRPVMRYYTFGLELTF